MMTIKLATKPESNSEILARSFTLYRASILRIFPLSLLLAVVIFIPLIFAYALEKYLYNSIFSMQGFENFIFYFFEVFIFLAILWRMHGVMVNAHETVIEDAKIALHKIIRVIIAGLIVFIITSILAFLTLMLFKFLLTFNIWNGLVGMTILSVVILIYMAFVLYISVGFYFYMPLILMENARIISALMRSFSLVFRNWWRVFLLQILPWITYAVILLLIGCFYAADVSDIFLAPIERHPPIGISLLSLFIFALMIPWGAALLLLQLHDLEVRKHYNVHQ